MVDEFIVALTIWREARGIRPEGLRDQCYAAIYDVLRTRLTKGWPRRGPKTLAGVCLEPWQFSCHNLNDPNCNQFPLESNPADWSAWQRLNTVLEAQGNKPPTSDATHYHTYPVGHKAWPAWGTADKLVDTLGPVYLYHNIG